LVYRKVAAKRGANMCHCAKFQQNRSYTIAEVWRFYGFQNGGRPPSWIFEIRIFKRSRRLREPFCTGVPNFVKIGQTVGGDIAIFVIF